jgi:hypothetical protein
MWGNFQMLKNWVFFQVNEKSKDYGILENRFRLKNAIWKNKGNFCLMWQ